MVAVFGLDLYFFFLFALGLDDLQTVIHIYCAFLEGGREDTIFKGEICDRLR